ncbi:MAG: hypothetical protein RSD99_13095, partial [Janthinobacterium sp.]
DDMKTLAFQILSSHEDRPYPRRSAGEICYPMLCGVTAVYSVTSKGFHKELFIHVHSFQSQCF